jgi:F-type H+-transporting ATPase subunit gamma
VATLESLNRQLQVGEELHSVVGTMKGLAAVSIHDYEKAVRALREYTTTIELGLQILFRSEPGSMPASIPSEGPAALIVIGTDQGLCGPLNREIARTAIEWLEEHEVEPGRCIVVAMGRRAARELSMVGLTPSIALDLPGSVEAIGPAVEELVIKIDQWRRSEHVGRVMVVFQHPIRRTQHAPRLFQVIPADVTRLRGIAERTWPTRMLPAYPHKREDLLSGLLRQDLFIALYRAIAEARAAEHGARLAAMQAAEQNIEERLAVIRTQYHQLRQSEITAQLLDVVSGFETLREG